MEHHPSGPQRPTRLPSYWVLNTGKFGALSGRCGRRAPWQLDRCHTTAMTAWTTEQDCDRRPTEKCMREPKARGRPHGLPAGSPGDMRSHAGAASCAFPELTTVANRGAPIAPSALPRAGGATDSPAPACTPEQQGGQARRSGAGSSRWPSTRTPPGRPAPWLPRERRCHLRSQARHARQRLTHPRPDH